MELNDYLRVLRRRWSLVALATLLGLAVGFFTSSGGPTPITYTATQTLSVVQPTVSATTPLVSFTPSQLAVYATVGEVPQRVADELDYAGTPQELAATITAEPDDTVGVLRITATDADGAQAALVANTFGRKLRAVIAGDARDEFRTQVADAESEVDDLQRRVNALDTQLAENPPGAAVITAQRDALVNQYRIAYDEYQALRSRSSSGEPVVTLEAAVPQQAGGGLSAPKSRPVRMVLFGGLGLLLGAAMALVLDRIDTRIRSKDDAEAVSGLPVLAQIPFIPRRHRHELISATRPASPFAEAYRNLRSTLAFARSPLSGSAETTTTTTTPWRRRPSGRSATSRPSSSSPRRGPTRARPPPSPTGRQLRRDRPQRPGPGLRLPSAPPASGHRDPGDPGAGRCPRGRPPVPFRHRGHVRYVSRRRPPRAHGHADSNPARLFNRARTLIEASRRQADIVLVDTPPYLVANDAAELIPWADAVLITVKSRRTRRGPTERMIENLDRQQAPVVGIVLVGSDDASSGYSPYYYYRANARTDKAGRRWRRMLRLGPPKHVTSSQPEADEPQPAALVPDAGTATRNGNGPGRSVAEDGAGPESRADATRTGPSSHRGPTTPRPTSRRRRGSAQPDPRP